NIACRILKIALHSTPLSLAVRHPFETGTISWGQGCSEFLHPVVCRCLPFYDDQLSRKYVSLERRAPLIFSRICATPSGCKMLRHRRRQKIMPVVRGKEIEVFYSA